MAYDGLWRPRMAKDGHTPWWFIRHTPMMAYEGLWWPRMAKDGLWWPMRAYDPRWTPARWIENHIYRMMYEVCKYCKGCNAQMSAMNTMHTMQKRMVHNAQIGIQRSKTIATIATAKDLPLILWIWDRCCDLKRAFKTPKRTLKILKSDDSLERLCHELLERRRRGGESTGRYLLELITCLFWRLTVYEK